jgi:hypothetical protein
MNSILSWLGQLALLVVATFAFIVLYAHGFSDFPHNAQVEFHSLADWVKGGTGTNFPPAP